MHWLSVRKAFYCIVRPTLWRALLSGVAPTIEHDAAFRGKSFATIVDIGANKGQFSLFARRRFPDARIVAFEPIASCARRFAGLFGADARTRLEVAAIAEHAGTVAIHLMSRDDSSSLLRPLSSQRSLFGLDDAGVETVRTCRLPDVLDRVVAPALMKIDVQGAELSVLKGAGDLLGSFDQIYVECSFLPLYEGQSLASEVIGWLAERGFRLGGVFNQYVDRELGPVQADFLFHRRDERA